MNRKRGKSGDRPAFAIGLLVLFILAAPRLQADAISQAISPAISQAGWSLLSVDSQETQAADNAAVNAFDGDPATFWHTRFKGSPDPGHPHEIRIDLGNVYDLDGLRYLPRQDDFSNGTIAEYEFYTSRDGVDWGAPVAAGQWAANPLEKTATFTTATARFIRLVALSEVGGNAWTSAAELNVLGTVSSGNQAPAGAIDTPADAVSIGVGESINFTGTGRDPDGNTPLAYAWDFDGGAPASDLADPGTVRFDTAGTYTVAFTVTDALGRADPSPAGVTVTVNSTAQNQPPEGVIDTPTDDLSVPVDTAVTFAGAGSDPDGDTPLAYAWDFDGAAPAFDGPDPGAVSFDTAGSYTVTLTVTDALGLTDPTPASRVIKVQDPPASGGGSGGDPASGLLSQAGWNLVFVDSEEIQAADNAATNALDGDPATFWHTQYRGSPDPPPPHEIQIDLGAVYELSELRYLPRQDGDQNGWIRRYEVYIGNDTSNWGEPVATGTFARNAAEKTAAFAPAVGQFIRLVALSEANGNAWISAAEINTVGALFAGNQAPAGEIDRPAADRSIEVGASIDFAGTGNDPDGDTPLAYHWDFNGAAPASSAADPGLTTFDQAGTYTVTFTVTDAAGRADATPPTRVIRVRAAQTNTTLPQSEWRLRFVDSEELAAENDAAVNAFDGNPGTFWHTEFSRREPAHPHEIQIDLGSAYAVEALRYLPRQDSFINGTIRDYAFYVSPEGEDWGAPVATGRLAGNQQEQQVVFTPKTGQFIRLVALNEVNGRPWTSVAEINVEGRCDTPYVRLLRPDTADVQTQPDLAAVASVCLNRNTHPAWGVRFTLDGGAGITDTTPPYRTTFSGVALGDHRIAARIVDAAGSPVAGDDTQDTANQVGSGDAYVALGDSITFGLLDDDAADDTSRDGRNTGGGYTPVLNDRLTQAKAYPHTIINEGVPGAVAADGVASIAAILADHPDARFYLIEYGTNDAGGMFPVPPGLGLRPGDAGYPGSFKARLQTLIDRIRAAGNKAYLAKVPYSQNLRRNDTFRDYNRVIDELVGENGIPVAPPDFYSYFEAHPEQFSDRYHPDGAGYRAMAELWSNALP